MSVSKDFHVHERHSGDALGATVEGYCRLAEERGLEEICFTAHLILRGPDREYSISESKISEYLKEIEEAQDSTSVDLRAGMEVDYFPEELSRLSRLLRDHSFDFVLGSLHYIGEYDIGSRQGSVEFFSGRRIEDALDEYFRHWKESVESGLFDVMAHPDYFRKYISLTHPSGITFKQYGSTVYDAIDSLKSHNVGVEVNSSGFKHGVGDCYPSLGFLKTLKERGVETVTIGSDSHAFDELGMRLDEAVRSLHDAGYEHICAFRNRRKWIVPVENTFKSECSHSNP